MNKPCVFRCVLSLLILLVACVQAPQAHAQKQALTDEDIAQAIERIKEFLYKAQDEATGGWYGSHHNGPNDQPTRNDWGPSSMAVLALIVSGESPQNPKIAKALELLGEVEITGTYAMSMRAHVWSYLPQSVYRGALSKDAAALYRSHYGPSRFGYIIKEEGGSAAGGAGGRIDNSTTQYGILGLWQASKRGLIIPDAKSFWEGVERSFLELQAANGGWGYSTNSNPTETMTLAGLTCLYVAQQELYRDQSKPNAKIQAAIARGLAFLDENFTAHGGGHGRGYKWYGYERVGLASGRKYFRGQDWFQEIAKLIVQHQGKHGSQIHEAAFDLMFLARGGVPVWINKLEIPDVAWNNRPNDVYYLNRYISEYREHEVNWQAISIESNPEEWVSAPLMWLSSDDPIDWTADQIAKIKLYLDLGGTLIANPEGSSKSFRNSIEDLAKAMYPDLEFANMDREHPMASLLVGNPRGNKKPDISILSNGARVLIIMPKEDWGMTFQADKNPDPRKTDEWRHITNIYGVVTDRGELTPRLSSTIVTKADRASTGTIKVVIPQWQDPAGQMLEQDVYSMMRNYMHNTTGKQLLIEQVPFSELVAADPSLLHLVGVRAVEIKPDERDAIQAYLNAGGTLLIENLGGTGDFVQSMRTQLGPMFPGDDAVVSKRSDIVAGRNLPEGAQNNRKPGFRRLVLERANPDALMLLRGHTKGERMPVLISYEDLSLGMLGVRQYGINGYSIDYARNLMVNILLEANKAHPGSTAPAAAPVEEAAAAAAE